MSATTVCSIGMLLLLATCGGCSNRPATAVRPASDESSYLFVWAGDAEQKASDFLGVIDATPFSPRYGEIVASIAVGQSGTHPHHTEIEMPASRRLLANGFHAGRTWLFDLSQPTAPKIVSWFNALAGFSHPHTFTRLPNGHILATFQYAGAPVTPAQDHGAHGTDVERSTGGLIEMTERGEVIRSASASDPSIPDRHIYPYSALPLPSVDRIVSTTTDMNPRNKKATAQWIQIWRQSDLKVLRTIELAPGPRGDEHQFTGEPRLLADGKSVYVHTFNCGLYLLRDVDTDRPRASLVHAFEGGDCGVPVLAGQYWIATVPATASVVVLDVSNPENPRQVSALVLEGEQPHWLAIDPSGRRLVMNSGGYGKNNRLYVIDFDPASGSLSLDARFRDRRDGRPGLDMTGAQWPHGFSGKAQPHGTVFSR
jgi:hypothetical protein